ncbi:MAG TPA: glycosyltransferase, partial [Actinomycetota bacterium]|nr:glycosyltransferase [Actinomycetota bacterium]
LIRAEGPDMVLSTYPLTSAMLASLKRRGKITLPCANLVTDFAPHPMWMYPDLDDNYVMHISTVETVATMMEPSPTTVVAPLVARRFLGPSRRAEARASLGVPDDAFVAMVIGGGWGVGNIERSARAVASVPGVWTLVICGRNEELRRKFEDNPPPRSIIRGFVDNMPELIDACDLAVQNAGGLTSLEALRRGCPLLITDAIPGHGVANGELMDRVGVARYVRDPADLPAAVAASRDDPGLRERAEKLAVGFGGLPTAGAALMALASGARSHAAIGLPGRLAAAPGPATDPGPAPSPAPGPAPGAPDGGSSRSAPAASPVGGAGAPAASPVAGTGALGGLEPEEEAAPARHHRTLRLSAAIAALVAAFLVVTSGASVSFAASHLGLDVVAHTGTGRVPAVVLCIRASKSRSIAGLPQVLSARDARATLFVPAQLVSDNRGLVESFGSVGEIQNGGTGQAVSRLSTPTDVLHQVSEGTEEVRSATGHAPVFFLPANGSFNAAAFLAATSAHQRGVVGSVWIHARNGHPKLKAGDVVVLDLDHASASQAQAMLEAFLSRAAAAGLRVIDLSAARTASPDHA